jgi:hypothetical protein
MKPWLGLTLMTLTVGGGFTGFVITTNYLMMNPGALRPGQWVVGLSFAALYAFVVASGLMLALYPRKLTPLIIAFALQVPWISSPLVTYRFTSGFNATAGLANGSLAGALRLGSDFQFFLQQSHAWGGGINLFALVILIVLVRASRRQTGSMPRGNPAIAPERDRISALSASGGRN